MNVSTRRVINLFQRPEKLVYPALFLLFVAMNIPGTAWGLPGLWHPNELVIKVVRALQGKENFDETTFTYPSLPKYVMYGLGKIVLGQGYSQAAFVHSARIVSVLLGALVVVLVFHMTRVMGGSLVTSLLAAFLILSSSELASDARFAHNDIYITFFSSLAVLALIGYYTTKKRIILYLAFLLVGFAASSKYNGASLLIAPGVVLLWNERKNIGKDALRTGETLFIGLALSALGYIIGTPKALLWMAFYIKRVLPVLTHHATYAREPGSEIGLVSQWSPLRISLGTPVFCLFLISFVWFCVKPFWSHFKRIPAQGKGNSLTSILILSIVSLDLPMLISYNQQFRFFLPLFPLFAVLSALFIEELFLLPSTNGYRASQYLILAGSIVIVFVSFLRVISVDLLFQNDTRKIAGEYLRTLPENTSIEYTPYHPNIPPKHFSRAHSYPIYFIKHADQEFPKGTDLYKYNEGLAGLERRNTDFLIIDSFTYSKFADPYVCQLHSVECSFFKNLQAGQTPYKLVESFHYSLPVFLPQLSVEFLNPDIQIYRQMPSGN